jgi:hypothetical protein
MTTIEKEVHRNMNGDDAASRESDVNSYLR